MTDRIEVCPTEELPPGEREIVEIGGISIGVFNVEGEYHALLNDCAHQHGPLCEGDVSRRITAEFVGVGEHVEERFADDHMVVCPWHGWAFDVRTGEHVGTDTIAVPTYDVAVDGDTVYVEL